MEFAQGLGLLAGTVTTLSFLPQVIKIYKSRSAKDISLGWVASLTFGVALWLAYGLMIGELPVILSNMVTLVLAGAILAMKLWFERAASTRP